MIDRAARDEFVLALRRYAGRRISNDELDDLVTQRTADVGLAAVKSAAYTLYSDLETHLARDKHALTKTQKKEVARWIVFLKAAASYTYPEHSAEKLTLLRALRPFVSVLTLGGFGRWIDSIDRKFAEAGDLSVWPFASRAQLRAAIGGIEQRRAS